MSDTDLNDGLNNSQTDQPVTDTPATETATAQRDTAGDDWGAALAEQAASSEAPDAQPTHTTAAQVFPAIEDTPAPSDATDTPAASSEMDLIADIPVQLSVELGRTRMTIKQILQLGQGSVIELDSLAGQPMDIYINGYLIAQGEVVVVDERYGIRLTDIITPADRLSRLNRQPVRRA